MNDKLNYKDLIDLHYLLTLDKEADALEIHRRDRQLYLGLQGEQDERLNHAPASLISAWIDSRCDQVFSLPEQKSPGSVFSDLKRLFTVMLAAKGFLTGILAGILFFSYSGTTPVNVFHFLLYFIFSQLLLSCILVTSIFFRTTMPRVKVPSFYSFLFLGMIKKTATFFSRHFMKKLDATTKLNINTAFGLVKINSRIYGSLFYWPLFLFSQVFGVTFNLGLLVTTLVKLSTSDLAFGWQSTIQLSSAVIHQTARLLALPWYYLVPTELALPSIEEIEGSRIILKEGIYHLSTLDLVAWWPFLVFCLLFYGLFLRSFFYGFGKVMERKSLRQIQFDSAECQGLLRRMQTPVVSSQAAPEPAKDISRPESGPAQDTMTATEKEGKSPSVLVLVPDEIFDLCKPDIYQASTEWLGFTIDKTLRFMENYEKDQLLLDELAESEWNKHRELLIIVEGWMVPLVGFMSYLGQLRQILPDRTLIHLGLVGCPKGGKLTPIEKKDYVLWEKTVTGGGDPYLHIFPLLTPGGTL